MYVCPFKWILRKSIKITWIISAYDLRMYILLFIVRTEIRFHNIQIKIYWTYLRISIKAYFYLINSTLTWPFQSMIFLMPFIVSLFFLCYSIGNRFTRLSWIFLLLNNWKFIHGVSVTISFRIYFLTIHTSMWNTSIDFSLYSNQHCATGDTFDRNRHKNFNLVLRI